MRETFQIINAFFLLFPMMIVSIREENAKWGRAGGGLSQQGWGILKQRFIDWKSMILASGRDLIFIAHEVEARKSNDDSYFKPAIVGGSYSEVLWSCDGIGYLHLDGRNRILDFDPTSGWVGKNPCNFKTFDVPNLHEKGRWLASVIKDTKAGLGKRSEASAKEAQEVEEWREFATSADSADDLNHVKETLLKAEKDLPRGVFFQAKQNMWRIAGDKGFSYDRETEMFKGDPSPTAAASEEPGDAGEGDLGGRASLAGDANPVPPGSIVAQMGAALRSPQETSAGAVSGGDSQESPDSGTAAPAPPPLVSDCLDTAYRPEVGEMIFWGDVAGLVQAVHPDLRAAVFQPVKRPGEEIPDEVTAPWRELRPHELRPADPAPTGPTIGRPKANGKLEQTIQAIRANQREGADDEPAPSQPVVGGSEPMDGDAPQAGTQEPAVAPEAKPKADPIEAYEVYRGSLTVGRPVRFTHPSSHEWVRGLVKEIDGETVLVVPEGKSRAIRLALDPDRVRVVDEAQGAML